MKQRRRRKNVISWFIILAITTGFGGIAKAGNQQGDQAAQQPKTIKLTVDAAGEPIPALKYSLLPKYLDQTPGNAVTLYYQASELLPEYDREEFIERFDQWMELPAEKLTIKELELFLSDYSNVLHQLELATRRERCDWELPIRTEGIDVMMPALSKFRHISRVLILKAKLQTVQGQYEEAIKSLQTGYAMARHLAETDTLVSNLVGIAVAAMMSKQLEQFIQAPQAPNLYWALTGLGEPFIDIRHSMSIEYDLWYLEFPELGQLERMILTGQQIHEIYSQIGRVLTGSGPSIAGGYKIASLIAAFKQYPEAKRSLIEQGLTAEQVEAIPVAQVVLMSQVRDYNQLRDDLFKWFNVPYSQALAHLAEAEQELVEKVRRSRETLIVNPFYQLLPALSRAYLLTARQDRQIAVLRCVEAIRMYAAEHDGELPGGWGDIRQVPIPIDPVRGKEFIYRLEGGKAIIEAPPGAAEDPTEGLRYELTIRN
ncbi:MAG: hypothetical protein AMJ79_16065 [Phycisphaerae bacterium SM23_30]|nr:MAG: hypothetical protein AMJ79_16065 [Phycisphaerae bacterium SM23_30]